MQWTARRMVIVQSLSEEVTTLVSRLRDFRFPASPRPTVPTSSVFFSPFGITKRCLSVGSKPAPAAGRADTEEVLRALNAGRPETDGSPRTYVLTTRWNA